MKISDVRELLKSKEVIDEINRHLWIESQKAGYSIGIERATDEWLKLYAEGWMKYHMPDKLRALRAKTKREGTKKRKAASVIKAKPQKRAAKKAAAKKAASAKKKVVKKKAAKKPVAKKTAKKKTAAKKKK